METDIDERREKMKLHIESSHGWSFFIKYNGRKLEKIQG